MPRTNRPKQLWVNLANWDGVMYEHPIALAFDPRHHVWIGGKWHLVIHEDDLVLEKPFISKVYATRVFASFIKSRVIAWQYGVTAMQQVLADTIPERFIKSKATEINNVRVQTYN